MNPNLGPCCICGGIQNVRNILAMARPCAVPGHGWGCVVCGLPANGAVAVICNDCLGPLDFNGKPTQDPGPRLRYVCRGYPASDGRQPIAELSKDHFEHDKAKHRAYEDLLASYAWMKLEHTCRRCGCTDDHACIDSNGVPCHWVEEDLCSSCVEPADFEGRDLDSSCGP